MARFHLPTIEEEQLKAWEEKGIFRKVLAKDSPKGKFVFFEGPPTANGKPGIHHVLTRAFKDIILRFRTMQGYHIDRKAGWDTHGLPVELQVEKALGFTKKQDIEDYGVAAFNKKCKESVWEYRDLWEKMTKRSAFWVDLDDPYVTYENGYVESVWSLLKKIDGDGRLYKGFRITPHCPRCVTSLSSHELAQGYKDTEDPSVYVKFAVTGEDKTFFLVWTTTPWTLPANVALAVGPEVTYAKVRLAESGEMFILAEALLGKIDGPYEVVEKKKGSELVGIAYQSLFATLPDQPDGSHMNAYRTYAADFVSTVEGTGIVHIAPAYGEDDAALGKSAKLPVLHTVDATAMVTADVPGKGKFFKKADNDIRADLTERGLLYKDERMTHSYPFCWRCGTPLLYYAKSSWYIKMEDLRGKLDATNHDHINWVPEHIKDGRFGEWLRGVKDWALSRERYWGTPLPVWSCDCGERTTIGSLDELDDKALPKNRYFLQRHGQAETNATDTLSCYPEPKAFHLTEKGRDQVALAAKELSTKKIDLIFASDILRTKETAETIAKELGLPIVFDERLRELAFGRFNGGPEAEYKEARNGIDRFETAPAENAESLNDVRRRMVAFFKEIDAAHHGKNILIVSHGDPLWMLQTVFRGLSKEEVLNWPHYNHTGQFIEMEAPKNAPYDELGNVDVHRPYIDDVRISCGKCGNAMMREKDVIDVWFDSGAMPFAQWHYPMENATRVEGKDATNFPADFIAEAIDQTRGWFYTLLAVSTLMGREEPPYKNVICLGHVLDAKGQKMSKSKGNVVDPWLMFDKHGSDAIRFYLFTVNQPGEPKRFDEKAVEEVTKKVFLILWNVLTFWQMFRGELGSGGAEERGSKNTMARPASQNVLDRWILAKLAELSAKVTGGLEAYDVVDSGRSIVEFVNDLSTWYVRRSRDRFKADDAATRDAAVATLGYVLHQLALLMAPYVPFLAEALYKETGGPEESVHLTEWPAEALAGFADEVLLAQMETARKTASVGLERRAAVSMPVRQVLAKATVTTTVPFEDWMRSIVADELNVDAVEAVQAKDGTLTVELDIELTPDLRKRGSVRELTRTINDLRKQAGFTPADRIVVTYATDSPFWNEVFAEHGAALAADVRADALEAGTVEGGAEVENGDGKISIAVRKV
jgi:isoleucyl-tRNA synthetase